MSASVQAVLSVCAMLDAAERVELAALLMQEMDAELPDRDKNFMWGESGMLRSAHDDIEEGEYGRAIAKARGDWEPPDAPGWEGGFAPNH